MLSGSQIGRLARSATLALIIVLAVRLSYLASHSVVGWETIYRQWRDAAIGWTGLQPKPLPRQDPPSQARFWLAEIDRIRKRYPDSAKIAMGAAWILDSPCPGYYADYISRYQSEDGTLHAEKIRLREEAFQSVCREQCLRLAEQATHLQPEARRWWRIRALLQFYIGMPDREWTIRNKAWLDVLDSCSQHDPGNALYDYLAAMTFWNQALSEDWQLESDLNAAIEEADLFTEGKQRFDTAQRKTFLSFGESGLSAITSLLSRSRLPRWQQKDVAMNHVVGQKAFGILLTLSRVMEARAELETEPSAQVALHRQVLHMYKQYLSTDAQPTNAQMSIGHWFPAFEIAKIRGIHAEHPDVLSHEERELLKDQEREHLRAALVYAETRDRLAHQLDTSMDIPRIVFAASLVSCAILLEITLLLAVVGCCLPRPRTDCPVTFRSQLAAWFVGISLTFLVLGVAPAEVLSRSFQSRVIYLLGIGVLAGSLSWAIWRWSRYMRHRRHRFHISHVLLVILGCSLILAIWRSLDQADWPEFSVPARGWKHLDADSLQRSTLILSGSWTWAFMQWSAWYGPYVQIALSLAIVALWAVARNVRGQSAGRTEGVFFDCKQLAASAAQHTRQAALLGSAIFFTGYLLLAPEIIRQQTRQYEYEISYSKAPDEYWRRVNAIADEVRGDRKAMAEIYSEIDSETDKWNVAP